MGAQASPIQENGDFTALAIGLLNFDIFPFGIADAVYATDKILAPASYGDEFDAVFVKLG